MNTRIRLTSERPNLDGLTPEEELSALDEYAAACLKETTDAARAIATDRGIHVIDLEVQYDDETTETWESTGDALRIDFTGPEPTVETLPPYGEDT